MRNLGRNKVEPYPVGTRLKMYKCFEVGVAHGPLCLWEVVLVVINREGAIDGLLGVCALAEE